jgi:hypothetical protein
MLSAFVAQGHSVNPRKEMFTRAEKKGRDSNVHLVDQLGLKVLADGADAATQPDILPIGGFSRPLQSGLDAVGDKMKGGSACHRDGWPCVMGQHKDRHMVRWTLAPPPPPTIIHFVALRDKVVWRIFDLFLRLGHFAKKFADLGASLPCAGKGHIWHGGDLPLHIVGEQG